MWRLTNFCGFKCIQSVHLPGVLEKLPCLTPFSEDAQPQDLGQVYPLSKKCC
jgi:hypothetical protein